MSGVCAASDIWSVGCTVIELLTCLPPYYDLQPMPALFRIVQVSFTYAMSIFFEEGNLYLKDGDNTLDLGSGDIFFPLA